MRTIQLRLALIRLNQPSTYRYMVLRKVCLYRMQNLIPAVPLGKSVFNRRQHPGLPSPMSQTLAGEACI